jgi:putative chitinase
MRKEDHAMTPQEWKQVLRKMEPHGKDWIIDGLADAMPGMVDRYGLNTAVRQQHFLAQVAHESDHFKTTREYASGKAYEGRKDLGNTHKGDGERFRGRGLIQLTGRSNYTAASLAMAQPFVEQPDLVEKFPAAATVSGWWWSAHGLNEIADRDDVRAVTKRVNGGYNGLDSRTALLTTARTAIG